MIDRPDGQDVESEDSNDESSRRSLGDLAGAARGAFGRSYDRLTGSEFRRQFEEFTNAVSTAVVGVHRDQAELKERFEQLQDQYSSQASQVEPEQPSQNRINPMLVSATLLLSLLALIIGVVALLRTF